MTHKLAIFTITAFLLVSIVGYNMSQSQLIVVEDSDVTNITYDMEQIITEYIEEKVAHKARGGPSFAAQEIYGTEQNNDGKIYVYLWTYYMEYYLLNGELRESSGASLPLVLVLEEEASEQFIVAEHYEPTPGSEYGPSVRRLFPEKYHDRVFSRDNTRDLEQLARQRAERYFNESFGQKESFGIYLASSGELVFSEAHLKAFHSDDNSFELNEIGIERWNSYLTYQTVPKLEGSLFSSDFVLKIEGREICKGKLWSSVSSVSYSGIVILDALFKLDSSDSILRIESGYPGSYKSPLDVNISSELVRYFEKKNLLK